MMLYGVFGAAAAPLFLKENMGIEETKKRITSKIRHQHVLADNALLQAKNTKLEKELKEAKETFNSLGFLGRVRFAYNYLNKKKL